MSLIKQATNLLKERLEQIIQQKLDINYKEKVHDLVLEKIHITTAIEILKGFE